MKKILLLTLIFFINIQYINAQTEEKDREKAKEYFNIARKFRQKSEFDSAITYFQKSGIIYKKYNDWNNYLVNEYYSAELLMTKGALDKALTLFNRIEIKTKEKIGEENNILAGCYQAMGQIYFYKGDMNNAIERFDRAVSLKIALHGEKSMEVADLYNNLGIVFSQFGDYDTALKYYNDAINIKKDIFGGEHPSMALIYNNIGIIFNNKGEYDKALENFEKSKTFLIESVGEKNMNVADVYMGIASVYIEREEFDQAETFIMKSLEIKKSLIGEDHYSVAKDYVNLGIVFEGKGDNDMALQYYFIATDIYKKTLGENHPELSTVYNNVGSLCRQQGNYKLALQYYNYAIKIQRKMYGDFHPEIAAIYSNIGIINTEMGNYDEAIENQEKSLMIFESIFGNKHPRLVEPYLNLASAYLENEDNDKALLYYQKSIIANITSFNPPDSLKYANPQIKDYYNGQKLLRSLKDKTKTLIFKYKEIENNKNPKFLHIALETVYKADTLIDIIRRSTVKKSDKIALAKLYSQLYENALFVCYELSEFYPRENKYKEMAFYFSERNKSATLLEALAGADARKFAGIPDSLIKIEKSLREQISYYEKQLAELSDPSNEAFYREQLFNNNTRYNKLIVMFETKYPKYYEMKYSQKSIKAAELRNKLGKDLCILSYFIGEKDIFVLNLTKNDISFKISSKPNNFEDNIRLLHQYITSGQKESIKKYLELGYKIHETLLLNEIPLSINKLLIIPDGILGIIPFEALLTEEYYDDIKKYKNFPYLIRKYNISYTYSANLFYYNFIKKNMQSERPNEDWIGIAPVFKEGNPLTFNNIKAETILGSEQEINQIHSYFKEKELHSKKLLNKNANEWKFKRSQLNKYKIIHIATHGYVDAEKPELSCLLLSRDPKVGDDGILYSGEIYNLNLNSDIVILSACETGLGKITKGEGIIGLSRALLYAGSKNIIVSLWKVSDISTTELMIDFYSYLLKESDTFSDKMPIFSDKLYQAKINMIDNEKYAHPFFWSPFILIGK